MFSKWRNLLDCWAENKRLREEIKELRENIDLYMKHALAIHEEDMGKIRKLEKTRITREFGINFHEDECDFIRDKDLEIAICSTEQIIETLKNRIKTYKNRIAERK